MSYESDDNRGGMAERSLDLLLDGGSSSYIQIDLCCQQWSMGVDRGLGVSPEKITDHIIT